MAISPAEFDYIRELVRRKSGIVLEAGKEYLAEARLSSLCRQEKLESISTLVARLKASQIDPLHRLTIEAMTTNETSFFRDHHPFEAFKKVILPGILASRAATKSLSIWCAASSTGQEPYTIAMTLLDAFPSIADWKLTFLATDLSTEMVNRSKEGKYNQIEVNRGLPATLLVKYFEQAGHDWQIKKSLRSMIDFRQMNLVTEWPMLPPFDIVFMRNVLIYFDSNTKRSILSRVRKILRPDGYFFLGCAETTLCLDDSFERLAIEKSGCYRMKQQIGIKAA